MCKNMHFYLQICKNFRIFVLAFGKPRYQMSLGDIKRTVASALPKTYQR